MIEVSQDLDRVVGHDSRFDGPWLKWGQGVVHSQTLERDVEAFAAHAYVEPLLTHRTEYQPKRHGFAILVDEALVPTPTRWGLLLGDVANNYRSALDQLAWALVCRGTSPSETLTEWKQRGVYFPISIDRKEFNKFLPKKLPGVRRADVAIVRAFQPYVYKSRGNRLVNNLVLLTDINTADKHRTVQPVLDTPEFIEYEITNARDCVVTRLRPETARVPLQVDAEIGFVFVRKTGPNPQLEVDPHAMAQPTIDNKVWLRDWLDGTRDYVAALLANFSSPPEELLSLEIDFSRIPLPPEP